MQSQAPTRSPADPATEAAQRLVPRYIDFIYAAAARQTMRDAQTAADVAQTVVLIMLNKSRASSLPEERYMLGWLLKVTRYAVMQVRRSEARRARHEAKAAVSGAVHHEVEVERDIREALDAAILRLNPLDREVIVRRHLRQESLAEIGAAIGTNENTAGRRVARALEKLHRHLTARGIVAPAATVVAVLAAEAGVKAPSACASIATAHSLAAQAADRTLRVMWMAKSATWLMATFAVMLAAAATVAFAVQPWLWAPRSPTVAASAPINSLPPQAIDLQVTGGPEASPEAALKQVLDGLAANQAKLRSIHTEARLTIRSCDFRTGAWLAPTVLEGEAWAEPGAERRQRDRVALGQTWIVGEQGEMHRGADASYVEAWDGATLYRLYGPPVSRPSAETFDTRYLLGERLLGNDFSMQMAWDEETSGDVHGTRKDIDRYPLAPAVLKQMKLSARHVRLDGSIEAVELQVVCPSKDVERTETFYFDAKRGYGLLARKDTFAMQGRIARSITRRIDELAEASPGVFYPTKAEMYWEQSGRPIESQFFEATRVVANEAQPPSWFVIDFPAGVPIRDFRNGVGTKRSK